MLYQTEPLSSLQVDLSLHVMGARVREVLLACERMRGRRVDDFSSASHLAEDLSVLLHEAADAVRMYLGEARHVHRSSAVFHDLRNEFDVL